MLGIIVITNKKTLTLIYSENRDKIKINVCNIKKRKEFYFKNVDNLWLKHKQLYQRIALTLCKTRQGRKALLQFFFYFFYFALLSVITSPFALCVWYFNFSLNEYFLHCFLFLSYIYPSLVGHHPNFIFYVKTLTICD